MTSKKLVKIADYYIFCWNKNNAKMAVT